MSLGTELSAFSVFFFFVEGNRKRWEECHLQGGREKWSRIVFVLQIHHGKWGLFFRCGTLGNLFAKVSPAWSWLLRHVPFKERWGVDGGGAKLHGEVGKLLRQTMSFYVIPFTIMHRLNQMNMSFNHRRSCSMYISFFVCVLVCKVYVCLFCMHYSKFFIMFFRCMLDVCKFIPCCTSIFYLFVYLSIFLSIYIIHNDVFIDMINHSWSGPSDSGPTLWGHNVHSHCPIKGTKLDLHGVSLS